MVRFLLYASLPDTNEFFVSVREYMIREHRKFILDIREHVHLRDFGKSWRITYNPTALNSCQEWLSGTEKGI